MNALFVAWRGGDSPTGGWGPIGRLEFDAGVYRFWYTHGARHLQSQGFWPFSRMDDLEQVYESTELFPIFANRLLSPSRPEYEEFLRWGGFDPDYPPDPISILGVTEGIRQTDAIEVFPCPVPGLDGCYVNKFFLHGVRWVPPAALDRISELDVDESLYVMPDPYNDVDPNAVAIRTGDRRMLIGYVPRYLAVDVLQLMSGCSLQPIQLYVERVNPDAPLQQRVLCRMHACWPDGFEPCSGPLFEPIPAGVSNHCETI